MDAQEICDVMRQIYALRRGLPFRTGSTVKDENYNGFLYNEIKLKKLGLLKVILGLIVWLKCK